MSNAIKPSVFVGSSAESLKIAEAIQKNLEYSYHVTVWNQGIFKPSSSSLTDLIEALDKFDFAIFAFNPDDITKLKNKKYSSVRDNVIFEMGLFIGKIGKERTFYIKPRNVELLLPSDLIGFNPATYDSSHPNILAALGSPCSEIEDVIKKLGKRV